MSKPTSPLINENLEDAFTRIQRYVEGQPGTKGFVSLVVMARQIDDDGAVEFELASDGLGQLPDATCVELMIGAAKYIEELAQMVVDRMQP